MISTLNVRTLTQPLLAFRVGRLETALAVLALCLALASVAYRAAHVVEYPVVNADEGYYGHLLGSRIDPAVANPDAATNYDSFRFSGLSFWPYGLASSLAGSGYEVARLVSVAWGALLLLLTFGLVRELYGWLAGGVAALVLALSQVFLLTSSLVRPEAAATAIGVAGAWLAWRGAAQGRPSWPLLVAGVLAVNVWQTHPANAGLMALAPLAVLARSPRGEWVRRMLWLAAGLAIGVGLYVGLLIAPDPAQYFAAAGYARRAYYLPLLDRGPIEAVVEEVRHLGRLLDEQAWMVPIYTIAVLAALAARPWRDRPTLFLLLGLVALFSWLAAMVESKLTWYLLCYLPLLAALVGRLVAWPMRRFGEGRFRQAGPLLGAAGLLALVWVLDPQDMLGEFGERNKGTYAALTEELRAVIPPGTSVAGHSTYWFALADYPYRDVRFVLKHKFMDQHGITFDQYLDIPPGVGAVLLSSEGRALALDKDLLDGAKAALERRGAREVDSFTHTGYGRVTVYLLDQSP